MMARILIQQGRWSTGNNNTKGGGGGGAEEEDEQFEAKSGWQEHSINSINGCTKW